MNSYLKQNNQIKNISKKYNIHNKTTQTSQKSQIFKSNLNQNNYLPQSTQIQKQIKNQTSYIKYQIPNTKHQIPNLKQQASYIKQQTSYIKQQNQSKSYLKQQGSYQKQQSQQHNDEKINSSQISNFYQTYINLFVNFFNYQADIVNLNTIKSIIRPNNRFVIIDLLKALLQFCRTQIKTLIKQTIFYQPKQQHKLELKLIPRNNSQNCHHLQSQQTYLNHQAQIIVDFENDKTINRRVQTQPEFNSPKNINADSRQNLTKISPSKQFRTKNSVANFLKHNSTQISKAKMDQVEQLNSRYLHAHFIDANIKQTMYQKNYQFVSQMNLQKLQSRINNIYIELNRLNVGNNEIITKFYEQNLGKKNKFNYDPRGLYSQSQILVKKQNLIDQISEFQQKPTPTKRSNSIQLTQYALLFSKYKNKIQELISLQNPKNKLSKAVSSWIPLRIQYSQSIIQPLKLQIQEINSNTGQMLNYHWKKYKKQFSIIQFFKQKVKAEYQKVQQKNGKFDKNIENQLFKKKKFRKSLFLDNRKKINQFIQSNNVMFTKKQSIFPVLKGIQQSFIKNSNNINNQYSNYALDNNLTKTKDIKVDFRQQQRLKFTQNLTCKASSSSNYPQSRDKQKRFDSIKKTFDMRQKSQRKFSQSQKLLEKLPDKQKQKTQLLSRLSTKYDLPVAMSNRVYRQTQKYDKRNLISMSKIIDIRSEMHQRSQAISKTIQVAISQQRKLTILNLT